MDFPTVLCYTERKDAMRRKPGVFPLTRYKTSRMELPDGSESGEIIVYLHRL